MQLITAESLVYTLYSAKRQNIESHLNLV